MLQNKLNRSPDGIFQTEQTVCRRIAIDHRPLHIEHQHPVVQLLKQMSVGDRMRIKQSATKQCQIEQYSIHWQQQWRDVENAGKLATRLHQDLF
jgi:hypothetical protein